MMKYLIIFILFLSASASAQYSDKNFGIGLNFVYTTNARIYLTPNSSNPVERNSYFGLTDIFNPGINIRYKLVENVMLDLSLEYMQNTATGNNEKVITNTGLKYIKVEDGFRLIPIELSVYYLIPFSTEKFKFLMGGGVGYYYGSMIRKFGNAEVSNVERNSAYGIQVAVDVNYLLLENIAFKLEMKFRDPQFIVRSRYNERQYNYNGTKVTVTRQEFDSKIDINGVAFVLGTVFYF
ncbi:MAG: outer membrane beta-barrel protein [Ignavibacteriaceae bacterium]